MVSNSMSSRKDTTVTSTFDVNEMKSFDYYSRGSKSKNTKSHEKESFEKSELDFNAVSSEGGIHDHGSRGISRTHVSETFEIGEFGFGRSSEDIDFRSECQKNGEIETSNLPERCSRINLKPMVCKPTLSDQYANRFQNMDEVVPCSVVSAISMQNDCDTSTILTALTRCENTKTSISELNSPLGSVDKSKMNYICKDPRIFGLIENSCPKLNMNRSMIDSGAPIRKNDKNKDQTKHDLKERINADEFFGRNCMNFKRDESMINSHVSYEGTQNVTNDVQNECKLESDTNDENNADEFFVRNCMNFKREESMIYSNGSYMGTHNVTNDVQNECKLESDTNDENCGCFGELDNIAIKKPVNYIQISSIEGDHDRKTSLLNLVHDDINSLNRRNSRSTGKGGILKSKNNAIKSKSIPKSPKNKTPMIVGNPAPSLSHKTFMTIGNSARVDLFYTKREESSSTSSKLYEKIHCGMNDLKGKKGTSKPFREISSTKIYTDTSKISRRMKKKQSKLPKLLSNIIN